MPILEHNNIRVLYLHIPKTGGTTLNNWFGETVTRSFYSGSPPQGFKVCPQHLQVGDFRILFGEDWFDWKFALVRNPYHRMESEYFYLTHNTHKRTQRRPDFSSWVIHNLGSFQRNPFLHDNHLRPQVDFLDEDVTVFRYEDGLDGAAEVIAQKLGIDAPEPLPVTNARPKEEVFWSLELLNLFNNIYAKDFELLGYELRTREINIHS